MSVLCARNDEQELIPNLPLQRTLALAQANSGGHLFNKPRTRLVYSSSLFSPSSFSPFPSHLLLVLLRCDHLLAAGSNLANESPLRTRSQEGEGNRRGDSQTTKTRTTYGQIFYCIDIHKQPGLDHPRLKNHTIQMRPSEDLKGTENETNAFEFQNIGLKNGGCPLGTVPILKIQGEDILRAGSLPKFGKNHDNDFPHYYAVEAMRNKQSIYGASVVMNVWKPEVHNPYQFSLGQIWVTAGDNDYIEAGWQVYPYLYDDYHSHLFVLWTSDDYTHYCYNLECKGFVQTSKNVAPGSIINPVSTYNGTQHEMSLSIIKDVKTGHWFLKWGQELVGYWPKELFKYLADRATSVEWGGEVAGSKRLPEMGSGHFPNEGFGKASFISQIRVMNQPHQENLRDVDPTEITTGDDMPDCYKSSVGRSAQQGTYILFGGPGGNCVRPA
ncbi:hypothetical protein NE237_005188 [Protea cynaroides]|uniref:Neprosin PEP catalytic domain-containing protein n=1 Tax=Protea cynaroides TaxID=273540 RepID=A0A9Q0QUD9_9MAGN|nr:hypothetical protein NE237_005188 [Protea cynaroides]